MSQIAAILDSLVLYRYSLILALACGAGVCFFMACCSYRKISASRAAAAALVGTVLALLFARLVYWYGRPDRFSTLLQALTSPATEQFALIGAFAGCIPAALLVGGKASRKDLLDCMSIAGCGAIALGRLGCFFTDADRGQVMTKLTSLPWAFPVANASGQLEYRFATFLFQAAVAALLGVFLALVFSKKKRSGEVSILFVLIYSASQILLDSTRYDSLYLRSNGFISIVQILCAVSLVSVLVMLCIRAVRVLGRRKWMYPLWLGLVALLGLVGYMEYYVQRHGREAAFSYSVMGISLACLVAAGLLLWHKCQPSAKE